MRTLWIATLAAGVVLGLSGCAGGSGGSSGRTETFEPLFNGFTLHGWVKRGGNAEFSVERPNPLKPAVIVGRTAPNTENSFLCTEREYADFVLEVEFLIHPELNSGVQFRSRSDPAYRDGRVHGYQAEIDPSERAWTGGVYDEGRRGWLADLSANPDARAAFKQNEWNHMRVEAVGERIRTWINGVPAADLTDGMTRSGFVALQVHGVGARTDPLEVRFRNVRIREVRGD